MRPGLVPLDHGQLESLRSLGEVSYRRLIDTALRDVPETLEAIERASIRGDFESLRQRAHFLKGTTVTFGADALAGCCLALERAAARGERTAVTTLVEKLLQLAREFCRELESERERMPAVSDVGD